MGLSMMLMEHSNIIQRKKKESNVVWIEFVNPFVEKLKRTN
jgi:hypothetical protein